MSQMPPPQRSDSPASNGLGIAGFVISVVALVSGGCLAPVGLVLSIIALRREPKGLAVAGVVIGAVACLLGIAFLLLFLIPLLFFGAVVGVAAVAAADEIEFGVDTVAIIMECQVYQDDHGVLPETLDDLDLRESTRLDPWGRSYVLEIDDDGENFAILSLGPDGQAGTEDDMRSTSSE